MEPDSLTVPLEALYNAGKVERDRILRKALQTNAEEMNRRGVLNSSIYSASATDLVVAELQPRADLLRSCVMTVVGVSTEMPSDKEEDQIVEIANSLLTHEFRDLYEMLAGAISVERDQCLQGFQGSCDVPRKNFVYHLSADIAARNVTLRPTKGWSDYRLAAFSAALVSILAVVTLAIQKDYFEAKDRNQEMHFAAQQEIRKELLPKLEALRLPLADVANASESSSLHDYQETLQSAITESDHAIASLSDGYDLLRTRLRLEFDSGTVASLDSIGSEAQTVRDGLQRTLLDSRSGMRDRSAKNPGENLESARQLNAKVSRFEERLLTHK
jgi:hypothetical protein